MGVQVDQIDLVLVHFDVLLGERVVVGAHEVVRVLGSASDCTYKLRKLEQILNLVVVLLRYILQAQLGADEDKYIGVEHLAEHVLLAYSTLGEWHLAVVGI